jgi:alpha-N-arabinofuranosidase
LFFGVRKTSNGYTLFLEEVREGILKIIASEDFTTPEAHIMMGMDQENTQLNFYFSLSTGERIDLIRNVDAKMLSTRVAGGFVGTTIGIHVRSE